MIQLPKEFRDIIAQKQGQGSRVKGGEAKESWAILPRKIKSIGNYQGFLGAIGAMPQDMGVLLPAEITLILAFSPQGRRELQILVF